MIMTVEELKSYIDITAKDPVLEAKLQANMKLIPYNKSLSWE